MSDPGYAARQNDDGSIDAIFIHWGGSYLRNALQDSWTDPAKVHQLIELGNLSLLGPEIGEQVDFNSFNHSPTTASSV